MKRAIGVASALIVAGIGALGVFGAASRHSNTSVGSSASVTPVLVELFTSEGCSSCPPADELLRKLKQEQNIPGAHIIALGQHVDYWNNLGWSDPYSSHVFSERQHAYSDALHLDEVYTPQMIVDGQTEFVGSNAGKARRAIEAAAKEPMPTQITLTIDHQNATIQIPALPAGTGGVGETADVYLAVVEDDLSTEVKEGENAGRHLAHAAVTRQLATIGAFTPGKAFSATVPLNLSPDWKPEHLSVVAFVQAQQSRRILGAQETRL